MVKLQEIKNKNGASYRIFIDETINGEVTTESKSFATRYLTIEGTEECEQEHTA